MVNRKSLYQLPVEGREPEDSLLTQLFERHRREALAERRVLLATLVGAVVCFQLYRVAPPPRGRSLIRDAEEWISGASGGSNASFVKVCRVLGLRAGDFRQLSLS